MRLVAFTTVIFVVACWEAEPWEGEVVSSFSYAIPELGALPSEDRAEIGRITVPARDIGFLARASGAAIEQFSRALSKQVRELGANVVVPIGGGDAVAAAEAGQEFSAIAYRCPG